MSQWLALAWLGSLLLATSAKTCHSVVLLEARNGAVVELILKKAFGRKVELGGGYMHWTQPHVWHELQRHSIPLLPPLEIDRTYCLADGIVHTGTQEAHLETLRPATSRRLGDARARFPRPFEIHVPRLYDIDIALKLNIQNQPIVFDVIGECGLSHHCLTRQVAPARPRLSFAGPDLVIFQQRCAN